MICKILKKEKEPSVNAVKGLRVALVVGHSDDEQGAKNVFGVSEYDYWNEFTFDMSDSFSNKKVEYKKFIRPFKGSKGIEKAYKNADKWGADAIIEFHFNSYNGVANGCETLCSHDRNDIEFASTIQRYMVEALGNIDRGVKKKTKRERGGRSTSGFVGANCLIEPFFGDVTRDVLVFEAKYTNVMVNLDVAVREYFDV